MGIYLQMSIIGLLNIYWGLVGYKLGKGGRGYFVEDFDF